MARLDPQESFEALKEGVKQAIGSTFPQVGDKNVLEVEDIEITDQVSSADYTAQKKAKMNGRTWGVPVHATLVLKDKKTGKIIDKKRQKIAQVPKITDRYSYIVGGSEFQVDGQWRLRPGVYTKVKQNGELDSFFNIQGRPLHVGFDPKGRKFNIQHGGAKPPLYPVMKALGISDDTLERKWGKDILNANKVDGRGRPLNVEKHAMDFAKRLDPKAEVQNFEQAAAVIRQNFDESKLHPEATERTLGKKIDRITPEAMLLSSGRLLGVARGKEKPDTRDSLMFKDFHGVEDFVHERITGHAPIIARRIRNNLDRKDKIQDIVGPDIYNRPIQEFFGKVSLANTPTQTNPLKMISGQMKTTIAGEGGVADANRITEDAKLVDPSHFGVLDPLHTPEGSSTGVSLQLALGARKQGNRIVVPLKDAKTGKTKLVDTAEVHDSNVALPDEVKQVGGKFVPKKGSKVLASTAGNEIRPVSMKDVKYVVPRASQMFSLATNMVPYINSDSPNRATMAGRHMEQAIPVEDGEPPLVQSAMGDHSFDEAVGQFASSKARVSGTIAKITPDSITIRDSSRKLHTVPIYNNYPLNDKKGFIHSTPKVAVGEKVKSGQLIADTNFSVSGREEILVLHPDGVRRTRLDEFVFTEDLKVLALSYDTLHYEWKPLKELIKHPTSDPLVKITTRCGRSFRVTASHSCLTVGDDGQIVEVCPKDMIEGRTVVPILGTAPGGCSRWDVAKYGLQTAGSKNATRRVYGAFPLSREFGFLLGMYLSEGDLPHSKYVRVGITNAQLRRTFLDSAAQCELLTTEQETTITIGCAQLARAVDAEFGHGSTGKRLPGWVFAAPRAFLEGLIDGIWSGDGSLYLEGDSVCASIQVDSEDLARSMQILLSELGVVSSFSACFRHPNGFDDPNDRHFRLWVAGATVGALPPLSHSDKEHLRRTWAPPTHDKVAVAPMPKNLCRGHPLNVKRAKGFGGLTLLRRNAQGRLSDLVNGDVLWDLVEKVEEVDPEPFVYDLSVGDHETFVLLSGVTVHNTKDGVYAPGKNLHVAYTPWKGLNFEDGVVISDSAAQKMTSVHLHKKGLSTRDASLDGKKKYQAYYPDRLNKEQAAKLGDDGVVMVGQRVKPGDTLVAALADQQLTTEQQKLRMLHKSLVKPKKDKAVRWEEDFEGEVVEVNKRGSRVDVHVKTREPMEVGDKLVGRHGNKGICFDPETEVLTRRGWVRVGEVIEEDEVCTLGEGRKIEYQRPTRIIRQNHSGKMYRYHGRWLSLFTTPEHQLYVRTRRGDYRLEPARSCFDQPRIHLRTGVWEGEERREVEINGRLYSMDRFLEFFGYWATEGSLNGNRRGWIAIAQSEKVHPETYRSIYSCVTGLGHYQGVKTYKDQIVFKDDGLYDWLKQFGKARDKFIPRWMLELSQRQLRILADKLFEGDGGVYYDDRYDHTRLELFTSSVRLAGDYQELALKLGLSANVRNPKKDFPEEHVVRWTFAEEVWTNNDCRSSNERWEDYEGQVHCVEVPNHVIYVRRDGTPVWCGNCTKILPDSEMPKTQDGVAVEVLLNPIGIPGRMNVGQVLETATGKLAMAKGGKPIKVENFSKEDNLTLVQKQLKEAGLSDKEDLIDPRTGKTIPGIQTGYQFIMKMEHQVGKKMAARERDAYDHNLVPRGGGKHGAQALGALGVYAMLAHGARENLREMQVTKSDKSQGGEKDEMWTALQAGEMLPPPKETFAYEKFNGYLKAMGVNTRKDGNSLSLMPMTDAQILEMSNGEIKDGGRILKMKTLKPEKNGLFDERVTGGVDGTKWGHITLTTPMPNPLFEKAIMSLSGVRGPQFAKIIDGKAGVSADGKIVEKTGVKGVTYGPQAVGRLLEGINVDEKLKEEEARLPKLTGQLLNESRRRIKYLRALKKLGMTPTEAYMTKYVPVLPPSMRPISVMEDGSLQTDDLNELYKGLALVNNQHKAFPKGTPESLKAPVASSVYDHMKALTGLGGTLNSKHPGILDTISGKEGPKTGFAQAVLIKRKQDLTARSTIVPDPALSLDEAALPRKAAKEMYKPFIVRELRRAAGASPLQARKMIETDDPLAQRALERVVKERPVLLKRDPVLHKYGIQAFKPRLVDGKAIKIHPLVCSGYNADFDGDSVHGKILVVLPDELCYDTYMPHNTTVSTNLRCIEIADFPRLQNTERTTKKGFAYDVPECVMVPAYKDGEVRMMPVTEFSIHPDCEEYRVKTRSGREVFCSSDHSLAVFDPEKMEVVKAKPAGSVGFLVPVMRKLGGSCHSALRVPKPLKTRNWAKDTLELDRELGWLLGTIVGNGWVTWSRNRRPHQLCLALGKGGEEVAEHWKAVVSTLCDGAVGQVDNDHEFDGKPCTSSRLQLSNSRLAAFVARFIPKGARNKILPKGFLGFPEECRWGLLCGLIDTDGSVNWSRGKGKKQPQFSVSYTTVSPRLAEEVRLLGLSLGLPSSCTEFENRDAPAFILTFSTRPVLDAIGSFKLFAPSKVAALERLRGNVVDFGRNDIVPMPEDVKRELLDRLRGIGATKRPPRRNKAAFSQYVVLNKSDGFITRTSAERIRDLLPIDPASARLCQWRSLVFDDNNLSWDVIESAEATGDRVEMYDLTVPDAWTFTTADGLVVWDTMSAFVPISSDAVKEAHGMFPSNNLFSPSSHGVMYSPSHEQQVGLFMATQTGNSTNKKFKGQAELEKAFNAGEVKLTDVVSVGGVRTTLGRVRVDAQLPKEMRGGKILRDLKYNLTKKEQGRLFGDIARSAPKDYPAVADKLKNIGNETASTEGFSFGIEDFKVHKDVRDPILRQAAAKASKLDPNKPKDAQKIVDIYGDAMIKLEAAVKDKAAKGVTQLDRLEIAAGIKGNGYRQLTAAPVLFVDGKGEVVPNPVTKSYSEGLPTSDYWSSTSGGRKGIIQKVQSVSEPGYLTKMMTNSVVDQLIDVDDCGTDRGIALSVDEPDIIGRYTTAELNLGRGKKIPSGTLLTPELVTKVKNNKNTAKVVVRTPMRCNHPKGLCQKCAGLNENGELNDLGTNVGITAAQALGERGTQLAMKAFHSGGVYEGKDSKSLTADGLDRATSLLYLKQKVKGSAVLAETGGKIRRVKKDPAGGVRIKIGESESYVPADRTLLKKVRVGQRVKRGDPLTSGPVNPHELLPLTNVNKVQGHLASELHNIYGKYGIRRRHSEVMVRALTNVTKVEDPGENEDYLKGDFASTSQVQDWNRTHKGAKPIKHVPVLRGVKQIPLDVQEDWMARLNHEHLRSTMIEASQQGWSTDLHGLNPIPPLIHGVEFGKGTKKHPHRY